MKLVDVKLIEYTDDLIDAEFVNLDNTIRVLSTMTGLTVEEIELLSMANYKQMESKISFMSQLPSDKVKPSFKLKNIEEITLEEYIVFINYTSNSELIFPSLPNIIRIFNKSGLDEEQIKELGMDEVFAAFFLLRKQLKKSLGNSIRLTVKKLIKLKLKEANEHLLKKFKTVTSKYTNNSDSIS